MQLENVSNNVTALCPFSQDGVFHSEMVVPVEDCPHPTSLGFNDRDQRVILQFDSHSTAIRPRCAYSTTCVGTEA